MPRDAPRPLADAAGARHECRRLRTVAQLVISRALLAELTRILRRPKFDRIIGNSGVSLDDLVLGYAELATLVTPDPIPPTVLSDPDDDQVLACALSGNADLIVSGERHLLSLKTYRNIPIVTPAKAAEVLSLSM